MQQETTEQARQEAGRVAGTAQEQARTVAGTAGEQARNVAGTAQEQARQVAQQATEQARTALHQVHGDIRQRADEEAGKLAQTLHDTSRQLRVMADADEQQGIARTLVSEGASAAERIAGRIDAGGLDAVLADVRSMARRNPGSFLLGAAIAGFAAGRVIRHLNAGSSSSGGSGQLGADGSYAREQLYVGATPAASTGAWGEIGGDEPVPAYEPPAYDATEEPVGSQHRFPTGTGTP